MSCPAVIGGIISELNGGSFSQGAIIGAASVAASMGLSELAKNSQNSGTTRVGEDADIKGKHDLKVKKEILLAENTTDVANDAGDQLFENANQTTNGNKAIWETVKDVFFKIAESILDLKFKSAPIVDAEVGAVKGANLLIEADKSIKLNDFHNYQSTRGDNANIGMRPTWNWGNVPGYPDFEKCWNNRHLLKKIEYTDPY